ncbi:MAG TPA: hypothetical protein PKA27_08225 [Fimbriimonadaceae bacterium]|nr:hypothetical protein [Fimbriimonadaceae bacterium]
MASLFDPDLSTWVRVTDTRNFIVGDTILDWLHVFGEARGFSKDSDDPGYVPEADFGNFIRRKGIEFEARVLELIDQRLEAAGLGPAEQGRFPGTSAQESGNAEHTEKLLLSGVPAIRDAVLWDPINEVYGVADLIVRDDVLDSLVEEPCGHPTSGGESYAIVEIKFTTLDANAQGERGNDKKHQKAQVALYNAALGRILGTMPPRAYFLGRGWRTSKERCANCLNRLVPVSLPSQGQFRNDPVNWLDEALRAVEWVRRVRNEGANWEVIPAALPELIPDMKNSADFPWHKAKVEIAEKTGALSRVWYMGVDVSRSLPPAKRNLLDPGFDPYEAAPGDDAKAIRQREMIRVNREPAPPGYFPERITWATDKWLQPEPVEFFVDFETASNLDDDFSKLPEAGGQALIWMIGTGHFDAAGQWQFKMLHTKDLTPESEREMIMEWARYMRSVRDAVPGAPEQPKVFHWSPAEPLTYSSGRESALARHLIDGGLPSVNWLDFLAEVARPAKTADAFFVKGAWSFGLKAIGKALYKLGHIQTEWEEGPADGLAAMGGAWVAYHMAKDRGIPVEEVVMLDKGGRERRFYQEIMRYNEMDCRVMADVIQFLRKISG